MSSLNRLSFVVVFLGAIVIVDARPHGAVSTRSDAADAAPSADEAPVWSGALPSFKHAPPAGANEGAEFGPAAPVWDGSDFFRCRDQVGVVDEALGFNETCNDYILGGVGAFTRRAKVLCCFDPASLPCCAPFARPMDFGAKCCATCDLARKIWETQFRIHGNKFAAFEDDRRFCQTISLGSCWSLEVAEKCPDSCGLKNKCFPDRE